MTCDMFQGGIPNSAAGAGGQAASTTGSRSQQSSWSKLAYRFLSNRGFLSAHLLNRRAREPRKEAVSSKLLHAVGARRSLLDLCRTGPLLQTPLQGAGAAGVRAAESVKYTYPTWLTPSSFVTIGCRQSVNPSLAQGLTVGTQVLAQKCFSTVKELLMNLFTQQKILHLDVLQQCKLEGSQRNLQIGLLANMPFNKLYRGEYFSLMAYLYAPYSFMGTETCLETKSPRQKDAETLKLNTNDCALQTPHVEWDHMPQPLCAENPGSGTLSGKNNAFSAWAVPEVHQPENHLQFLQPGGDLAILTPDLDHGYCSLEEHFQLHSMDHYNDMETYKDGCKCGLHSDVHTESVFTNGASESSSRCSRPEVQTDHQNISDFTTRESQGDEDKADMTSNLLVSEEDGFSEDDLESDGDEEEGINADVPVLSRPVCQNAFIANILGCYSSDSDDNAEQGEDGDISGSSDDDDGFGSEYSFSDSDCDCEDLEVLQLWNSFTSCNDPYNLCNFTAQTQTGQGNSEDTEVKDALQEDHVRRDFFRSESHPICVTSSSEDESHPICVTSSSEDESGDDFEESGLDCSESLELWNFFANSQDPYNPFNFKAQFQPPKSTKEVDPAMKKKGTTGLQNSQCCVLVSHEDEDRLDSGFSEMFEVLSVFREASAAKNKKVTFSDDVTEYYVSSQEDRKGPWEEFARDRCRFQKRVKEIENNISYCFTPEHRWRALQRLLAEMDLEACHSIVVLREDENESCDH